jgi:cell division septation protein DedD
VERTATHETEYVDIVLGYHHILLFSLVFGMMIFGTGYFIGYYRARSDNADHASGGATATSPQPGAPSPASSRPAVQLPAMLTEPPLPEAGDVVKEMEDLSTEALTPGPDAIANPEAASGVAEEAERDLPPTPVAPAPMATAAPPAATTTAPAATPAEAPKNDRQAPANGAGAPPAAKSPPRAAAKPANAAGNIYLRVSSFAAQQEAERLINELAAEGFRALIDGQMVDGMHTVLVGPFSDFQSAVGRAKELKESNREAFPVRR